MAVYAHAMFQNHNILPHDFYDMDKNHQAFMIASVQVEMDERKK